MQYNRLDPTRGLSDHLYELKAQLRANDTAPTGDVGLSGQIVATDPQTGVETIIGRLPDGSTGIQQWVNDVTPPGQPSAPLAEPTIGGVTISWDGKISGGTEQPKDYDRTEVEYSANGTIWSLGGTLYGVNSYTVPALTIGTEYSFRLISYDKNNNASTPSNIVLGTPVAMLDNPDLEGALKDLRDKDTEIAGNVTNAATAAENAAADALEAFKKANGVPTTFYGPTRPPVDAERVFVVGDQWIDTDDSNKMYVWDGNDFILAIDAEGAATQALTDLGINQTWVDDIEAQADSSISTYLGTDTPVNAQIGDLWLTGNADSPLKRFNGTIWETFEDPNILAAYQKAVDAQSAADKKIRTFAQDTEPSGLTATDVGDLWIDTNDGGKVYRWDETDWVQVIDNGTAAVNTALANLGLDETWMNDIEAQADRAITTFYGTATPVNPLDGDLWLTGVAGEPMKRRSGGAWLTFEDPNVQAAYERAGTALTEADKKIRTFAAATAPAGMQPEDAGDLWIDTDDGKISRWQLVSGTTYGWVQLVDNGTNAANKALTDLGLNAQWKQDIENQADRAIATFYGSASPTGMQAGDIWLSGVAGVPMKRWDGDSWETFEDPNVAAAYGRAGQALTAADSKIITYAQTTAPTGLTSPSNDGDLWINTSTGVDKGKISRFANNAWTLVTDNGVAAANKALADLGINQTWVNSIEDQADRAIDTFFGTTTPVNPQDGDLWLTGVAGEPMKRRTNGAWIVFEDPNIQNAYQKAVDANNAAAKVFESARSYVNPGTALTSIRTASGLAPTVVDSTTAMGGKALQKSGTGTGWWVDEGGKQAFDPNALYRVTARMRVTSVTTVNGGTFYMGLQGYAADGITRVNAAGADTDSSQHYLHSSTAYAKDGTWTEYVGYVRGNSLAGTEGGGFIATDPKKLHKDVRYIAPMFILDYSGGNGTWELSHWSIDSIDAIGYQALIDAATAQGVADSKIRTYAQDTAPTGLALKDSGDLWINTTAGDIKGQVKRWDGDSWELVVESGATATKSVLDSLGLNQAFVDSVNTLEDKAITTFYGPDTPVGPKEGDLWLKGTGIDPMQRWTNGAWVKFENPAVQSAYETAGDAEALADKKIVTYAQATAPVGTVDLPLRTGDLWIETDNTNRMYRYVQGTGAGTGWVAVRDTGIDAAQTTANTALKATAFSGNPSFDDWTSTVPNGYTTYTTAPTKETTTVRIPTNGARWSITTTGQQAGLQFAGGVVGGHLPNLEYYTVEVEFYLVSGTLAGAGILLDWNGASMLNNRSTINLNTEVSSVSTGKWYRVTKTVRRPTNMTGTWSSMGGFLMANYSLFGGAVKNIIFDWFNVRPATTEEITTFGIPARIDTLDGVVAGKGKTIIQSATPAVADRLVQNLWIDTTPIGNPAAPGNIPKRWDTATTQWVAVTEKAVVDAAAAAAAANSAANTAIDDANLAYQAAGERSRIVHLNTTPPTPADGWKDGDVWYKHTTTSITSPVVDWYIWKAGIWELQTLDETFLPLVNIGTGTYGFIKGTQLESKSISVEKLIVSSFDNIIADGEFKGSPSMWTLVGGTSIVQSAGSTGGPVLRFTGVNNNLIVFNSQSAVPVEGGNSYRTTIRAKSNINLITGSVRLYARFYTGPSSFSDSVMTSLTGTALTANTWTDVSGIWTAPANALSVTFYLSIFTGASTTTVDIDTVTVTRASNAKLIVDGSIDGKTITGALLQSRSETYRGIKLSGNQLIAYNSTNTAAGETFRIDGTTGAVTMKGDLTTGSTITGATITGALIQTSTGVEKIRLDSTSLRAFNAVGVEYFSIVNGEVNLTGVTNTKGNTIASAGSKPIVTSVGNLQIFTPGSNLLEILPGIQWKLDEDPDTMLTYPSIVSYDGTSLSITGGVKGGGSVWTNLEMNSFAGDVSVQASRDIVLDIMQGIGKIRFFGDAEFSGIIDQTTIASSLRFAFAEGASYGIVSPYFYTAPMGSPGLVLLNTDSGRPGIWFSKDGDLGSDNPAIYADADYNLYHRGNLRMIGPVDMGSSGSGYYVRFQTGFPGFYLRNDGTNGPEKSADGAVWAPSGGNTLFMRAPINPGGRGAVRIDSGTFLDYYDPPTSTFGANVGISSSPKDRFYKLTSAPKFKVNREMIDLDTAWNILNISPSVWYDRTQIEEKLGADAITAIDPDDPQIDPSLLDGLDLRKIPGVSAKDVEAAGLSQFVTYNAEGEVEGVSYDRMWILLVPILREIMTRLNSIDKKPVTPVGPLKPLIDPRSSKKK